MNRDTSDRQLTVEDIREIYPAPTRPAPLCRDCRFALPRLEWYPDAIGPRVHLNYSYATCSLGTPNPVDGSGPPCSVERAPGGACAPAGVRFVRLPEPEKKKKTLRWGAAEWAVSGVLAALASAAVILLWVALSQ